MGHILRDDDHRMIFQGLDTNWTYTLEKDILMDSPTFTNVQDLATLKQDRSTRSTTQ